MKEIKMGGKNERVKKIKMSLIFYIFCNICGITLYAYLINTPTIYLFRRFKDLAYFCQWMSLFPKSFFEEFPFSSLTLKCQGGHNKFLNIPYRCESILRCCSPLSIAIPTHS